MTTTGHALHPGEPGYDDELAGFQTGFSQRPGLVVPARSTEDVIAAVRYAADRNLPVNVQATGHGLPGPTEGGGPATGPRGCTTTRHGRGSPG